MFVHYFQMLKKDLCLSVHQLAYFLTEVSPIQGYLLFWMRYFFVIFWKYSWDISTLFPNDYNFLCPSLCQLAYSLLKLEKYRDISYFGWYIFLKFVGYIPGTFIHQFQIITKFCQSVRWLTSFLKLGQYRDISCSGWNIFLIFLETLPGCFYTISKKLNVSCKSGSLLVGLYPY